MYQHKTVKKWMGLVMFLILLSVTTVTVTMTNSELVVEDSSETTIVEPYFVWNQTYGGTNLDRALTVVQTDDNGFLIGGVTMSFGAGMRDMWLVKTDPNGQIQWNRTFGGSLDDLLLSIVKNSDGNYTLFGNTDSFGSGDRDIWMIKIDPNGVPIFNKTFGGPTFDVYRSAIQTSDGGFAITGGTTTYGAGQEDAWLIKTNSTGDIEWNTTYGGIGSWNRGMTVVQNNDSGLVIIGPTIDHDSTAEIGIIKTNISGDYEWNVSLGTIPGDWFNTMIQTPDGGYALAGTNDSLNLGDIVLLKIDENGTKQWYNNYGGKFSDSSNWYGSLAQASDGSYLIVGNLDTLINYSDSILIKTDNSGTMIWNITYSGYNIEDSRAVIISNDNSYIVTGYTDSFGAGGSDFFLYKISEKLVTLPSSSTSSISTSITSSSSSSVSSIPSSSSNSSTSSTPSFEILFSIIAFVVLFKHRKEDERKK